MNNSATASISAVDRAQAERASRAVRAHLCPVVKVIDSLQLSEAEGCVNGGLAPPGESRQGGAGEFSGPLIGVDRVHRADGGGEALQALFTHQPVGEEARGVGVFGL